MMNKHMVIDIVILAVSPLLSLGLAAAELAGGYMPFGFNMSRVLRYAFAPIVWFSYVGAEAFILWILPTVFLVFLAVSWCKSWQKRGHLFASLFTLCWIAIVQLFMFADAIGTC